MKNKFVVCFLLFYIINCYSQSQVLDTLIIDKKGKICYDENRRRIIYSGYVEAKICRDRTLIMKHNIADIFQLMMFISTGDYLNARKIYGEEYVTEFIHKYCIFIVKGEVKDGFPSGEWEYYDVDNNLLAKINFSKGVKEGNYRFFYPGGQLLREGFYIEGKKDGIEISYDNEGNIGAKRVYEKGTLLKQEIYNQQIFGFTRS